jgi:subtilase family serine protease
MKTLVRIVSVLVAFTSATWATQSDRITTAIDSSQTVVIQGTVYGKALPQFDRGAVDPAMKLQYITFQIAPSATQQSALNKLLAAQQNPASKSYHQWLTPEQFADQFGLSRNDISRITTWLKSQGFTTVQTARSRNWIAFRGTAAQVQATFHTQIDHFEVDGEQHYANATDISLPKALAGVVTSVRGLHNFLWQSSLARRHISNDGSTNPDYSNGGNNFLAPDDIATIYNIKPLLADSYDGTGINLVIVGQTDIATSDITQFRTGFNLPAINLTQVIASGCTDPGITSDQVEADLDLEWSGAVARNAAIIFDKCDTNDGGVFTALQDAIDQKRGPVISMSYGGCEPENGQSNATSIQTVIQQANSFGITFMASSGDSGAAACDQGNSPPATQGLEVNLPASVPETTAVGGNEFDEGSGNYWGTNGPNYGSAESYIPEEGWNDTSLGGGFASGGGGASIYFAKPSWQAGPGVPNDSARDVPDVSITASADHDGYLLCSQGSCAGGIPSDTFIVGGTSASSPVFAGIVTLLNQYLLNNGVITTPGLGNINVQLYPLAVNNPSAFHDVTQGSNIQPCTPGTPSTDPPAQQCPSSGSFGYSAGTGYDQVTGLGSVNAYDFVTGWGGGTGGGSTTTTKLALSGSAINVGTSNVTLTVTVNSGSGIPTGTVTFFNNGTQISQTGNPATLASGKATFTYTTSTLTVGTYAISATYNPTGGFTGSNSSPSQLQVQDFGVSANPTTVTITSPGQNGTSTITITPGSGGFSQTIGFTCSGLPSEATCSFSPTSVTPGTSTTTTTMTISTTAAGARLHETPFGRGKGLFYAMLLPGFLGLVSAGVRKRSLNGMRLVVLLGAVGFCSIWVACGGGSSSSSTPPNPGTPTGTSTVTVSATAGSLAHPATVSLNIQ